MPTSLASVALTRHPTTAGASRVLGVGADHRLAPVGPRHRVVLADRDHLSGRLGQRPVAEHEDVVDGHRDRPHRRARGRRRHRPTDHQHLGPRRLGERDEGLENRRGLLEALAGGDDDRERRSPDFFPAAHPRAKLSEGHGGEGVENRPGREARVADAACRRARNFRGGPAERCRRGLVRALLLDQRPAAQRARGRTNGLAVDNSNGPSAHHLYVTDPDHHRVVSFDPSGAFVLMFGDGVNETTGGDVYRPSPATSAAPARKRRSRGEHPAPSANRSTSPSTAPAGPRRAACTCRTATSS